jgi:hypothetical protein
MYSDRVRDLQESPISLFLCNIALSVLGEALTKTSLQTKRVVQYANDWLVLRPTKQRAETALRPLGLRSHFDETRLVHFTRGTEDFDFLDFHLHIVESWKWPGRYYLQRWPSDRAKASIKTKVREMTDPRYVNKG